MFCSATLAFLAFCLVGRHYAFGWLNLSPFAHGRMRCVQGMVESKEVLVYVGIFWSGTPCVHVWDFKFMWYVISNMKYDTTMLYGLLGWGGCWWDALSFFVLSDNRRPTCFVQKSRKPVCDPLKSVSSWVWQVEK